MRRLNIKLLQLIFFIVLVSAKVYSQNSIEWQQTIGGVHSEYLYKIVPTPDYGFLLVGSSFSSETGNKEEIGRGNLDYFLWKMDESGKMEWQKSYGGAGNDFLYSAAITKDGGFILGGSSATVGNSPENIGDKKHPGYGNMDFWILKLNPEGNEEWQLTLGGIGNDQLQSIQQTPDGGYIVGGSSDSSNPLIEDGKSRLFQTKGQDSFGSMDYWVVKLSATGKIEWEKTYGGEYRDELKEIIIAENGYIVAGNSNSGISGSKTIENIGQNDFWLIGIDGQGNKLWQKSYGGAGDENLAGILPTETGFLLAGSSNSKPDVGGGKKANNGEDTDFWVIATDKDGNPLWDNTYDIGKWDVLVSITKDGDNEFLISGYAATETLNRQVDNKGINDFVVIKINSKGEIIWQKSIGATGTDQLKATAKTRDGGYLLAGNSDSKISDDKDRSSIGGNDYWVVKLGNEAKGAENRNLVEVYPNPTYQFTNVVITQDFKEATVEVFDMTGRNLKNRKLTYRSTPVDLQGVVPGVYVFKITIDGKTQDVKVLKNGSK